MTVEQRLVSWDQKFPGRAEILHELCEPFYEWTIDVKQACFDLDERARRAIPWRQVNKVRSFTVGRPQIRVLQQMVLPLEEAIEESFGPIFDDHPLTGEENRLLNEALTEMVGAIKWVLLGDRFYNSLSFPCALAIVGKPEEARRFKPLHELWVVGNFPYGFDKEDNFFLLVAD